MKESVYGWQTSEESGNALSALLAGRETSFVPVAPLYADSPFRGYVDQRLCDRWDSLLEGTGTDRVEVEFDTYARFRLEVMCEIIDRFNSPPCWVRFPWTGFRTEVEGCQVARGSGKLQWIDPEGGETPLAEKLRALDRRPGPWPMEMPVSRSLEEVRQLLEQDPQGRVPGTQGDPSARWETSSEQDLRAAGCLRVWDGLQQRYQGAMPGYILGSCPTQVAMDMMGFETLMVGFLEAPDVVHQVFRTGMSHSRTHWQAVRDAGTQVVHLSEYSWGNQVSAEIYREFIAPYTRELIDFYHEIGFKVLLYVMGDIRPVLDQIAAQPFDALAIEEGRKGYSLDVGEIRRQLGDDRVLFGNVPCQLVEEGEPEDILAEVRRQISVAGQHGKFVVSIGEPLPPGTQPERVRFFCDSTRLI